MGKIATRHRDKNRAKSPTFVFTTKALAGIPKDSPAEAAEKARLISEFLAKKEKQNAKS